MIEYGIPIAIIVILILLNGLFVAAEFAIIGVRSTRITQLAAAGDRIANDIKRVLEDAQRQDRYIATAQVGITLASLGLGMYGEATMARWIEGPLERTFGLGPEFAHSIAVVVALSLLTFAHVVVGEMVPKSLALQYAERTVYAIAGIFGFIRWLFTPAVLLLNAIGNLLLRLLGIPVTTSPHRLYSPEELELVVAESARGGLLDSQQEQLIQNIFDFGERRAGQVMTPRPRIAALPITTPPEELPQRLANTRYSRLLVYDRDLDHVIGMLLVKEAIKRQIEQPGQLRLRELVRPMPIVPEGALIGNVLAMFKRTRNQIALVIDEYGGTAGIITLEDLVEEVVGEVRDEFDAAEIPVLREIAPGVLIARGDLLITDLRETANLRLPDEEDMPEVETIAGLVLSLLGRPAKKGDSVELLGTRFTVEETEGLAIRVLRIELEQDAPADVAG
jgi:CBS domain containing-hemolysin-like protein